MMKNKSFKQNIIMFVNALDGRSKYVVVISILLVIAIIAFFITYSNKEIQYMVRKGALEYSEIVTAYVIKDETVVETTEQPKISVVANGARVAKNGVIATYKGEDYTKYINELEKKDEEIHNLMQELPSVYSSEIEAIENEIRSRIKKTLNTTAKVEMQSSVSDINGLINKRANVIAKMNVSAGLLNELMQKRNEYVEQSKKIDEHILSPKAGIVSYVVDGLENNLKVSNIDELNYEQVEEIVNTADVQNKIKVVDNFSAYLLIKIDKAVKAYINTDKQYKIKLLQADNQEITANIYSYKECDAGNSLQVVLKIVDNIEQLIDLRATEVEIVWWKQEGLYVPLNAIQNIDNINYVRVIKYGQYVNIPVVVEKNTEKYALISNYERDELETLGITRDYILKMYDRIVLEGV